MDPRLLRYYGRELQYVRELGAEFARDFPKIAGRLGLDTFECSDPYVERLLEGFAFLSARVHLRMRITNQTGSPLTLATIKIYGVPVSNFAPAGSPALNTNPDGQDDAIQEPVIQPGKSWTWANCNCDGAFPLALNLPIAANALPRTQ